MVPSEDRSVAHLRFSRGGVAHEYAGGDITALSCDVRPRTTGSLTRLSSNAGAHIDYSQSVAAWRDFAACCATTSRWRTRTAMRRRWTVRGIRKMSRIRPVTALALTV